MCALIYDKRIISVSTKRKILETISPELKKLNAKSVSCSKNVFPNTHFYFPFSGFLFHVILSLERHIFTPIVYTSFSIHNSIQPMVYLGFRVN